MKVRFIVNPAAGSSGKLKSVGEIVRSLLGSSPGIFEVRATNGAGSASALSLDAVRKGYEFVFACGGDGTINDVARELVGTTTTLGIIPAGSGNALARTLNIPMDPAVAIGLLKTGSVRQMDVGKACGRYFFTTAGFGFEAFLSKKYNEGRFTSRIRGIAPYYALAIVEYLRYRPERITLEVDGKAASIEPFIFTAANTGQWGANAFIAPGASLDDGLIDFCVVPKSGVWKTLELGYRIMKGTVESFEGFQCVRGKKGVISGRRTRFAHVDGEPFDYSGDVEITVLPGALRVLTPGGGL